MVRKAARPEVCQRKLYMNTCARCILDTTCFLCVCVCVRVCYDYSHTHTNQTLQTELISFSGLYTEHI